MKKLILIAGLFMLTLASQAQDSIYLVNNTVVAAKITDINTDEITYKKFSNLDGPSIHEKKKNIYHIRYSNGDIEFYEEPENFVAGKLAEHGEPATIILISDKMIPCELMDISNLCVVYKEHSTDENTMVVMKSFVDRIYKKDSSFITFNKDGKEVKHEKYRPQPVDPPKPDPVVVAPEEKKTEPVAPPETKPKETPAKEEVPKVVAPAEKTRVTLKGDCELLDKDANIIKTKDVIVDTKNKKVTYVDQYNKIVTKAFGEIVKIYYKRANNNQTSVDLTDNFDIEDLEVK